MALRRQHEWIALLAACALFLAQFLVAGHETEHIGHVDDGFCEICLIAASHGSPLPLSLSTPALPYGTPPRERTLGYDAGGAYGKGNFKFQAEYLRSIKDTKIRSTNIIDEGTGEMLGEEAGLIGSSRKFTTDGLYAQMVYGFAPKWTAGLRYDVLGLTNKVSGGESDDFGSSDRWTLDLTWNLSEFSRLRAQYAHSDVLVSADERESFDAFYLQFLMSLGTHGAHVF